MTLAGSGPRLEGAGGAGRRRRSRGRAARGYLAPVRVGVFAHDALVVPDVLERLAGEAPVRSTGGGVHLRQTGSLGVGGAGGAAPAPGPGTDAWSPRTVKRASGAQGALGGPGDPRPSARKSEQSHRTAEGTRPAPAHRRAHGRCANCLVPHVNRQPHVAHTVISWGFKKVERPPRDHSAPATERGRSWESDRPGLRSQLCRIPAEGPWA